MEIVLSPPRDVMNIRMRALVKISMRVRVTTHIRAVRACDGPYILHAAVWPR